jgi:glutamate dehydrogenase
VRHDDDDPYLVVAADKGTAALSDVANAISVERHFWLGDAFASGGSSGYDHKKMGITARGAWESVKRHFRDLGVDTQTTAFTVVGVGDMSGDVFGNGMLLSRHIKLVGAFDHRHVFIDPDPDPAASFDERARLFHLPTSSWADYDRSLISAGGGVYPRTAKSIALSDQAKQALGIEPAASLTPTEVIGAMLTAPVDLLWNGGIGTYVKASHETHADAHDRTNDAVRVNASQLRCRVVAEGGNLGLTQPARIQFALSGGLINTDAVDNSAGVDCSDREVNIKILLDAVVAGGDMTTKQRNALLAEMTDDVARLVLRDNYDQTHALANGLAQAAGMLDVHARYMTHLEQLGKLDPELEFLPDEEHLAERTAANRGLTCPELAVLLAYSKILISQRLLDSDVVDDPYLAGELADYFPAVIRERFASQLADHRLRREILATRLANDAVNRAGTSFVFRMEEETGASTPEIIRAHLIAREVFAMPRLWDRIEACGAQISGPTEVTLLLEGRKLVERATRWLLRNRPAPLDISGNVSFFAPGLQELEGKVASLVKGADQAALEKAAASFQAAGVPAELAMTVASFNDLFSGLDIVTVAQATSRRVGEVAKVYFTLGEWLELDWVRDRIIGLPRADRWQALSRAALRDDLYSNHASLTAAVLRTGSGASDSLIQTWMERNRTAVDRSQAVLGDIKASGCFDLTTLCVALREIRGLLDHDH